MVNYFIKKEVETEFDTDKGEEVKKLLFNVYVKKDLEFWIRRGIIIALIIIILNIWVLSWIGLLVSLTLGFILILFETFIEVTEESFDSRIKAENYIKWLKKNE